MVCGKLLFPTVVVASLAIFQCQDEAGDVELDIYPDMSCHNGYPSATHPRPDAGSIYAGESELDDALVDWFKLMELDNECSNAATPGPNLPMIDDDYWAGWGLCNKFCVLEKLQIITADYLDGVKYAKLRWTMTNESTFFNELEVDGQPDFGTKLSTKVQAECAELFETVINVEKEPCNSMRAEDIYDCISNALKC